MFAAYGLPGSLVRATTMESRTVTSAVPETVPLVAAMVTSPAGPTEWTRPVLDTVAFVESVDDHWKDPPGTGSPRPSRPVAVSCTFAPLAIAVSGGLTVTWVATPGTATRRMPAPTRPPYTAMMYVAPARDFAVARPVELIVARLVSFDRHVTATPRIVSPVSSITVARYWMVPVVRIVVSAGRTMILEGVPVTVTGTSVNAPPPRTRTIVLPSTVSDRTSPRLLTVAIVVSSDAKATATPVTRWPSPSSAVTDSRTVSLRTSWTELGDTSSLIPGPVELLHASARSSAGANVSRNEKWDRIEGIEVPER